MCNGPRAKSRSLALHIRDAVASVLLYHQDGQRVVGDNKRDGFPVLVASGGVDYGLPDVL